MIKQRVTTRWYQSKGLVWLVLWPLSCVYRLVIRWRQWAYQCGLLRRHSVSAPVIVVGNITVGGTGKTPLTAALASFFLEQGYRPGLVSRGYGGQSKQWPQDVKADSCPQLVGDEPVMLVRQTGCPMVVGPDRVAAAQHLIKTYGCDVVLSDDGLQHYALHRDIEIIVMDGVRREGNGACLPAGPLREPLSRLRSVDFVIANGQGRAGEYSMTLCAGNVYRVMDGVTTSIHSIQSAKAVHAVAAIGHPQRFFTTLSQLGISFIEHVFPDHYLFSQDDFDFEEEAIVLMTEKDAVKCLSFADQRFLCLPVYMDVEDDFLSSLKAKLQSIIMS